MADQLAEPLGEIAKWALSWESRVKLLAAMIYIFGVISLSTPSMAIVAYVISVIMAVGMGIAFSLLVKRYLIIAPFLLLMTVPLLLGQGIPLAIDHVSFAALLVIKALTSMTVISILLDTQSLEQFMNSLAHLKVPPVLITIFMLSYRYVYLFLDDIQKMQIAAKSRFFNGGIGIKSLKTYGQLTGCLLIKSLDRSDHVYEAMASRCFNGTLQFAKPNQISKKDLLKASFAVIIISLLLVAERGYIH